MDYDNATDIKLDKLHVEPSLRSGPSEATKVEEARIGQLNVPHHGNVELYDSDGQLRLIPTASRDPNGQYMMSPVETHITNLSLRSLANRRMAEMAYTWCLLPL